MVFECNCDVIWNPRQLSSARAVGRLSPLIFYTCNPKIRRFSRSLRSLFRQEGFKNYNCFIMLFFLRCEHFLFFGAPKSQGSVNQAMGSFGYICPRPWGPLVPNLARVLFLIVGFVLRARSNTNTTLKYDVSFGQAKTVVMWPLVLSILQSRKVILKMGYWSFIFVFLPGLWCKSDLSSFSVEWN